MRLLKGPPTSRSRRLWKKAPMDLDKRVRCRPGGQQGRDIRPPARAAVRWPVSGPGRRVRLGATIRARPRRLVRESTCVCARGLCKTGPRPSRRPHGGPRIIIFGRPAHCPGAGPARARAPGLPLAAGAGVANMRALPGGQPTPSRRGHSARARASGLGTQTECHGRARGAGS